jgi:thiamine-phosphate pyrophosphorylase
MIVHLVTDRRRLTVPHSPGQSRRCLLLQAQHAIDAGVDCIQIRERDLEAAALMDLATAVVGLTRGTPTRVVINDRLDVALASGVDGVHLRGDSIPAVEVRRLAPSGFLIGRSVHTLTEAIEAAGADYLIAGTVWATPSKPDGRPLLGREGLAAIVAAVDVPVLAIGGVTTDHVADVAAAGISTVRRRFDTSRSRS